MGMGILSWIILGLVAGWLAGQFMQGGYGLAGDVVLGIVGAIVGGFMSGAILGRDMVTGFNLESVVVAFLGGGRVDRGLTSVQRTRRGRNEVT
jgi:uncharacterized membrane protein YeaQ/YmgE (transglycosylase-associated protein family)